MRHMNARNASRLCLAIATVVGFQATGCALPVIEGIFDSQDFAIFNDRPEARGDAGTTAMLVFVDMDDAELRTVSIELRELPSLPLGQELAVGEGAYGDVRPSVQVVQGPIVKEPLADGGVLISTNDRAKSARSTSGTVTLTHNDDGDVAGSFTVDLNDGGYLSGTFASQR